MKYIWIAILSVLTSCFGGSDAILVQGLSPKKQRQKIAFLQKKLEIAEKEKEKIESDARKLALEVNEAKLALIRRQIDEYEKKKEWTPTLFMEEREILYQLIQSASPQAFEAQVELDRILQLITELSDGERYVY